MTKFHGIRADDEVFKCLKLIAVEDGVSMGEVLKRLVVAEYQRRSQESFAALDALLYKPGSPDISGLNRRERRALKNKRK